MYLKEGGNIWPQSTDYDQTVEMIDGIVASTKDLIKDTGLEVYVIGSSANPTQNVYVGDSLIGIYRERDQTFTPMKTFSTQYPAGKLPENSKLVPKKSGDLDVMVDATEASKFFNTADPKKTRQALDDALKANGVETHKAGVTVHTLVPFNDKFYQVDIKVVPKAAKVSKFHHHNIPPGSPYKGVNKQMMINTLASMKGLLWSPDEGLYKRDAAGKKAEFLTDELDEIAQYLLGVKDASALGSVESIMDAIPNEATKQEVFAKAKASASWQAATPDAGTNEWFSKLRKILK